jgi:molybdopterin-guanine dinucleotide biosynthesis protein A
MPLDFGNETISVAGVVLAGGRAQRMGGLDKGLVDFHGQPLITQVLTRSAPQVDVLWISANRHLDRYRALGYPVIKDRQDDFAGPLAGIEAALSVVTSELLFVVACDMPRLPTTIVGQLWQALQQSSAMLAVVHDGTRLQSMCCLLRTACHADLQAALARGERKLGAWQEQLGLLAVDCADQAEAFVNINTLDELAALPAENLFLQ